jgi:hypothetical protein
MSESRMHGCRRGARCATRLGRVTREIWREALAQFGPLEDYLQVVQLFEKAALVRLRPGTSIADVARLIAGAAIS